MQSKFSGSIRSEDSLKKVKGKFIPLLTTTGILPILRIYTLNSSNPLLPHVVFETKSIWYFGCVLARHSSDLLVHIARNLWKTQEVSIVCKGFQIIQYQFPREEFSIKLIILTQWEDPVQLDPLKTWFSSFQQRFLHRLTEISQMNSS